MPLDPAFTLELKTHFGTEIAHAAPEDQTDDLIARWRTALEGDAESQQEPRCRLCGRTEAEDNDDKCRGFSVAPRVEDSAPAIRAPREEPRVEVTPCGARPRASLREPSRRARARDGVRQVPRGRLARGLRGWARGRREVHSPACESFLAMLAGSIEQRLARLPS